MKQHLERIQCALEDLEAHLGSWDLNSSRISDWSVGQQIEHVLKATSTFTVLTLRNRQPDGTGFQKQLKGLVLKRDSFPRGVAKAPDISLPGEDTPKAALPSLLLETRNRLERLDTVSSSAVVHHPHLGEMKRDEAVHFMAIHLEHHLSIIKDIVKDSE